MRETIYSVECWNQWLPNKEGWGSIEDYDNYEDAKEHARAEAEKFYPLRVRVKKYVYEDGICISGYNQT